MLPIFYKNPVVLHAKDHAEAGVKALDGFGFTARASAIPLNLTEIPLAARDYPIAFSGEDAPLPVAVVGFREENLFVDGAGRWTPGAYVPAYVRRYPFILSEDKGRDLLTLCIDDVPEVLAAGEGEPLFKDGKATATAERAMEFCKAFHAAALATQEFSRALAAQDLLIERQANAELAGGGAFVLRGFKVVDEVKVRALPGKVLEDWSRKNWLSPLFGLIQSTLNWGDLIDLLAARQPPAAEETARKGKKR